MSQLTHLRAKVAVLSRWRTPDDPDLAAARRNLRTARLEHDLDAVADAGPALTRAQADSLHSAVDRLPVHQGAEL